MSAEEPTAPTEDAPEAVISVEIVDEDWAEATVETPGGEKRRYLVTRRTAQERLQVATN